MRNPGPDDRRRRKARRISLAGGALLSAAIIWLSSWQGGLSRDAVEAHRSVGLVGVGALVAMVVLGWRRQRRTSRAWAARTVRLTWGWWGQPREIRVSVLVWCAVVAGVIGWDLFSFVVQSPSFPTLSTLIGHVTRHPVGRGILFALWLVLGVYAVSGSRAGSRR